MLKSEAINLIDPALIKLKILKKRLSNDGLQDLIKSFNEGPERLFSILQNEKDKDVLELGKLELTMNSDICNDINRSWDKLDGILADLIENTCKEIDEYAVKYNIVIEVTKRGLEKALNPVDIEMLAAETASLYPLFSTLLKYIIETGKTPDSNWEYSISTGDMTSAGITNKWAIDNLFKEVFLNDWNIRKSSEGHDVRDWGGYMLTLSSK